MPANLTPTQTTDLSRIQQKISDLDIHAKNDQQVNQDEVNYVLQDLQDHKDSFTPDQAKALEDKLGSLKQIVNGDFGHNTAESNLKWDKGLADINKIFEDAGLKDGDLSAVVGGHGSGTAFKNLTAEQAKAAGLPDKVAALQASDAPGGAQQVNKFTTKDNKNYFVASDNSSPPNYSVYNDQGASMGSMKAPAALGLNDAAGNWLVTSKDGLGSSWNTTDPNSLPSGTNLYDLNGATDKIKDVGVNAASAAGTSDPYPATKSTATLAFENGDNGKPGARGNDVQGPRGDIAVSAHQWVGVTGTAGDTKGTVYADVYTPNINPGRNDIVLKDASGKDITPDELKNGDTGVFNFSNGAQFISTTQGFFMVNGDTAVNIKTQETKPTTELKDQLKKLQDTGHQVVVKNE